MRTEEKRLKLQQYCNDRQNQHPGIECVDCPLRPIKYNCQFLAQDDNWQWLVGDDELNAMFAVLFEGAKVFPPEPAPAATPVAHDPVNHPSHYTTGGVECIDAMVQTQGVNAVKDFCICNAFKYLWRHGQKNGVEDVQKAIWYLNKFVELEGGEHDD